MLKLWLLAEFIFIPQNEPIYIVRLFINTYFGDYSNTTML